MLTDLITEHSTPLRKGSTIESGVKVASENKRRKVAAKAGCAPLPTLLTRLWLGEKELRKVFSFRRNNLCF